MCGLGSVPPPPWAGATAGRHVHRRAWGRELVLPEPNVDSTTEVENPHPQSSSVQCGHHSSQSVLGKLWKLCVWILGLSSVSRNPKQVCWVPSTGIGKCGQLSLPLVLLWGQMTGLRGKSLQDINHSRRLVKVSSLPPQWTINRGLFCNRVSSKQLPSWWLRQSPGHLGAIPCSTPEQKRVPFRPPLGFFPGKRPSEHPGYGLPLLFLLHIKVEWSAAADHLRHEDGPGLEEQSECTERMEGKVSSSPRSISWLLGKCLEKGSFANPWGLRREWNPSLSTQDTQANL